MNNKFRDKKIPGLAVEVRNDDVTRALRTWSKKSAGFWFIERD